MDDLKNRPPKDPSRINILDEWEVHHWTKELRVSRGELFANFERVEASLRFVFDD